MKLIIFGLILCIMICVQANPVYSQDKEVVRAKELWEQAIHAKGGRERLHSVRNLLVSSVTKYADPPKGFHGHRAVELFVLPDKRWQWVDDRPGGFGLYITTYDFGAQSGWELLDSASEADVYKPAPVSSNQDNNQSVAPEYTRYDFNKERFLVAQLIYLMETKWLCPTLVRVRTEQVKLRKFDVVETTLDGERIEFYLDQKTHLPLRVVVRRWIKETKSDYVETWVLDNYTNVNGVMLPRRATIGSLDKNETNFQINVEYDKGLFDRKPSIDMGQDAWKLSR